MSKKKFFETYTLIFSILLIGSFIGFAWENILTMIKGRIVLRQGLLYEPLMPIYGLGAVLFYFSLYKPNLSKYDKKMRVLIIFLFGFMMGGISEYICSYMQEKLFGTIAWDYSNVMFNISGRTSLLHAVFWGILSLMFYLYVVPVINKLKKYTKKKWFKVVVITLSIIFLLDCLISSLACYRRGERRENKKPDNAIEELLDEFYPDERVDQVFNNSRPPKK